MYVYIEVVVLIVVKCLGSSGDGGPASSARLYYADRTDVDSAGNVYIADTYNNVIRKVSGSTGIISTIAGSFAGVHRGMVEMLHRRNYICHMEWVLTALARYCCLNISRIIIA